MLSKIVKIEILGDDDADFVYLSRLTLACGHIKTMGWFKKSDPPKETPCQKCEDDLAISKEPKSL